MALAPAQCRGSNQRWPTICVGIVVCWLSTLLALLPAHAQSGYPDRPVRILVPYGPGGVADVTMRIVAQRLSERLGQQFVVENRPGAGGIIAAQAGISAPPDRIHALAHWKLQRHQHVVVQVAALRRAARFHPDLEPCLFRHAGCHARQVAAQQRQRHHRSGARQPEGLQFRLGRAREHAKPCRRVVQARRRPRRPGRDLPHHAAS